MHVPACDDPELLRKIIGISAIQQFRLRRLRLQAVRVGDELNQSVAMIPGCVDATRRRYQSTL